MKELLDYLTVRREDIPDLQAPENFGREVLISEVMRPAATTEKWRDIAGKKIRHEAADGITLVNCADRREEALTIALLLREAVERRKNGGIGYRGQKSGAAGGCRIGTLEPESG